MGARFEGILLERSGGEGRACFGPTYTAKPPVVQHGGTKSSLGKAFAMRPCSQTCILPNTNTAGDISGRGSRQAVKRTFTFTVNSKDTINDQCPGFDIELSTRRKVWPGAIAVLMV